MPRPSAREASWPDKSPGEMRDALQLGYKMAIEIVRFPMKKADFP
jgi:hypothetical protein